MTEKYYRFILIIFLTMLSTMPCLAQHGLKLNGTGGHISFGGPLLPELGLSEFTLECWVYRTGSGTTSSSGSGGVTAVPLICKGRGEVDGTNADCCYFFGIDSSGVLAADFEDMASGANHPVLGTTELEYNVWHHAAVTYDGATWRIYLDGALENEETENAVPRYDSIQYFSIGTATNSTGQTEGAFDGVIDEVRVWDHERSLSEIQNSMGMEIESETGLAGRWGLNEGTGTTAGDSSGNANDGTATGAVWVNGYPFALPDNCAGGFDGIDDHVDFGGACLPELGLAEFTLECWFYKTGAGATALSGSGGVTAVPLICKGRGEADGNNKDLNYFFGIDQTGVLAADFEDMSAGNNHPVLGTTAIANDVWHHAAVTYDGAVWRLFLDGELENEEAENATVRYDSIQHFSIATAMNSTGAREGAFEGVIDEVRVWNSARSQSSIQATMNLEIDSGYGLMGRWGFNDCTDDIVIDSTSSVNHGTMKGGYWVDGYLFSAADECGLDFDGADDHVSFGGPLLPELGLSEFTLECWIYKEGDGVTANSGSGGVIAVPLICKGLGEADGDNRDCCYFFGIDETGVLAADFEDMNNGSNHPVKGARVVENNAWHHVAATYDGTTWRLYLDGVLENEEVENATPRYDSIQHFSIATAMDSGGNPSGAFEGVIDEVRVWNTARSQLEIQEAMPYSILSATGLAGRWGFDECSGSVVYDTSGNENDGNVIQAIWGPGFEYTAPDRCSLEFDGVNDHITFGGPLLPELGLDEFTLECWIYKVGTGSTASSGSGGITAVPLICKGRGEADGNNLDCNYFFGIDQSGTLGADFEDMTNGSNHPVLGVTAVSNDAWHHVAVTYDGSTWRLYLNGALENELTVNATPRYDSIQHFSLATSMDSSGVPGGAFEGLMDEVRIWNFARSQDAIQETMFNELESGYGLAARWGFNECLGDTVYDTAGNNHGSIVGAIWRPGYFFSAIDACSLDFDGADDHVSFGGPLLPELGLSEFTIECWFYREGDGTTAVTGTGGIVAEPLVCKGRGETDGSDVDCNYFLGIDESGVLGADFEDMASGANHPVRGATVVDNMSWHHAAVSYSGSVWKLYLDGRLEAEETENATPRYDSIQYFSIATAMNSSGVSEGAFNGMIDEVRVWDHERSQSEIQSAMIYDVYSAPGLAGRWGFNECTGSSVFDTSGYDNDGTVVGAVWGDGYEYTPPDSCALEFDGTNDFIDFGGPLLPELGLDAFTLECWLYRKGPGTSADSGAGGVNAVPLICKGRGETDGSNVDCNYLFGIDESGVLAADFEDMNNGSNHPILGTTAVQNDAWVHAAVTYDGSVWKLYLNGELDNQETENATPRYDSIQHFSIATAMNSTGAREGAFEGILDEVRVWNYARTLEEIQSTKDQPVESAAGLAARWGFDDCIGMFAGDSSPNGNTGTVNGALWVTGYDFPPPNDPPVATLIAPSDGAVGLPIPVELSAHVSDPENSNLTVRFYGREVLDPQQRDDFTLVALPDTQFYSENGSAHFSQQTQWTVDNETALNIIFVSHLGDIVQNRDSYESEWILANDAMSILDGEIPYGLAIGNHDMYADGTAAYYDYYFPYTRYESESWYGGHYAASNYKSNYQLLTVSGIDLLFLHLEVDVPDGVISWADGVLAAYPDRICVLSTHVYLQSNGNRYSSPYFRTDGNSAGYLWNNLIQYHDNVKFVLCGHACETARRTDDNAYGNPVHQILSDYQCRPNGGDGWLRIMTFSPDNNEVYVQTYSPTLDNFLTTSEHEFTLSLDMTETEPFVLLAEYTDVPSDSDVSYTWNGLSEETTYEWYVSVEDEGNLASSDIWSFTTAAYTPTPTEIPTSSPTDTPSMTPTDTPTETPTLSPTYTPSDTPTETPTPTRTSTATFSPTSSPTITNSPTQTPTDSPTISPTLTPTLSPTMTNTPTHTLSPTFTETLTPSLSPTQSPTLTATLSPSSTFTHTPAETPTPTSSPTIPPIPALYPGNILGLIVLFSGIIMIYKKRR